MCVGPLVYQEALFGSLFLSTEVGCVIEKCQRQSLIDSGRQSADLGYWMRDKIVNPPTGYKKEFFSTT